MVPNQIENAVKVAGDAIKCDNVWLLVFNSPERRVLEQVSRMSENFLICFYATKKVLVSLVRNHFLDPSGEMKSNKITFW
jgi:hypothetical protein